eukprot:151557_1
MGNGSCFNPNTVPVAQPRTESAIPENKCILLGTGEQGKSTLFKRMLVDLGSGFDQDYKNGYINSIHENIIEAMKNLVYHANSVADRHERFRISSESQRAATQMESTDVSERLTVNIAEAVKVLWNDRAIRTTWEFRADIQVPDSAAYFFDRIDEIVSSSFRPNDEDVLRCRDRTTGVFQESLSVKGRNFTILDVGGQKIEREKWKNVFRGTRAIIYVVALSEYNQLLFEDDATNRLDDAIDTWDTIINHGFKDIPFVLIFNKTDLFREKIASGNAPFTFQNFKGEQEYNSIVDHVTDAFEMRNKENKPTKTFFKCALTDPVDDIFESISEFYDRGKM